MARAATLEEIRSGPVSPSDRINSIDALRGIALFGVLEWFAASPLVPRYFLGAIAILQVPLARVSAAPVAIAWSRHR